MARGELYWRGVGVFGLLVVTSSGERRKAPLLVTYGEVRDITKKLVLCYTKKTLFIELQPPVSKKSVDTNDDEEDYSSL